MTRTLELIKAIAYKLKDPDFVRNTVFYGNKQEKRPVAWQPVSLSHGYPSVILLMSTLERLFPEESWGIIVHSYILKTKDAIEEGLTSGFSLFSGLAGACFAIRNASMDNTRYQRLLKSLESHLLENLDPFYFKPIKEKLNLKIPVPAELYDVISGLIGIGIYFLSQPSNNLVSEALDQIVRICISLTDDIQIGSNKVPGWYIPSHYQFTEEDKRLFPKGNFNLGMAHGASGLVAFLSLVSLQGFKNVNLLQAIDKLAKWIRSKKRVKNNIVYWPNRISYEEEISNCTFQDSSMQAWCYGTAGVCRALYLAGKALNCRNMQDEAVDSILNMGEHLSSSQQMKSPTFCHGIAGLLTVAHLMGRDEGHVSLLSLREKLKANLLNFYSAEAPLGFRDHEIILADTLQLTNIENFADLFYSIIQVDKIGILDGSTGVLLTLLCCELDISFWAIPFLIEDNFV